MFLDYAETKAERRQAITMAEWVSKTGEFLSFNDYPPLDGPGNTSHNSMRTRVSAIYADYDKARKHQETQQAEQQAAQEFIDLIRQVDAIKEQP